MCFFSSPSIPAPPAPVAPPQVAKAPETAALKDSNQKRLTTGMGAGQASTLLTGPTGVDPNSLALGKSTLLGQ